MTEMYNIFNISQLSHDPREATTYMVEILFSKIYPLMLETRNILQTNDRTLEEDDTLKIHEVYALCVNQIKKTFQTVFHILKLEYHNGIHMQDSRGYTLERLSWCIEKLLSIKGYLNNTTKKENQIDASTDSILVSPMYFVNWIDHTFEELNKLANIIYKVDYKENNELCGQWTHNVVECLSTLHISVDELLLSAMTLCRHCLPVDRHVIKARCQVVLRETKALLGELIPDGDNTFNATPDSLKLPILPSNVNVLIDVLKDVLYALETNINTALLALLVHCFTYNTSPVNVLRDHFVKINNSCSCQAKFEDNDKSDDCSFVKEFDLYNERLVQIGSFAVSCSTDQARILSLRSGLASLEALDPHLVPALMLSPSNHHATLLIDTWCQEVQEIRDSVFLIVDPAAFAEKSKQLMHQILLEIVKQNTYSNCNVCQVINVGSVVHDFFAVYDQQEPAALTHTDKLMPLLADLHKVLMECKVVSNLLSSGEDIVYDVKQINNKKCVTLEQLIKRLKLLYTLVSKINALINPKENDDHLFDEDMVDEFRMKNVTHTISAKNGVTYVNSPKKAVNISRSIFARTCNVRSSAAYPLLPKLTRHLKSRMGEELSFSVKLDELFNLSDPKNRNNTINLTNKNLDLAREGSVLYNFSPKRRASLRKAVLSKQCKLPYDQEVECKNYGNSSTVSDKGDLIDETTSLQITDILNQMSNLTFTFSKSNPKQQSRNVLFANQEFCNEDNKNKSNVLRIDINNGNKTVSKHIWNIPVNASTVETQLDDSSATSASNNTVPSNVTTLERISDIDLVESRLSSLKSSDLETSL